MSSRISMASVCNEPGLDRSVEYSARAGRQCIDRAGMSEADIGLLVNIGVYRDSNMLEPAMASLIQKGIDLNVNPLGKHADRARASSTFSFDLINGPCGFFNAVQLADSFLATASVRAALVVASDVHPSGEVREDFPYTHLGAAALLSPSSNGSGFRNVVYKAADEEPIGARGYSDLANSGTKGREAFGVAMDDDYCQRLSSFASAAVKDYVAEHGFDLAEFKYVIAGLPPCTVEDDLAEALKLAPDQLIDVRSAYGTPFSAFPIVGFHMAQERGLDEGDRVLMFGAGAGFTFGCAVYEA